jgi:hypothetical protein
MFSIRAGKVFCIFRVIDCPPARLCDGTHCGGQSALIAQSITSDKQEEGGEREIFKANKKIARDSIFTRFWIVLIIMNCA